MLDFANAYIRLKAGTKGGQGNVLDSGWGRKDAETWVRLDAASVRKHVEKGGNLAILTGRRSGHFTVDVDPKNGGIETLKEWRDKGHDFPKTNRVNTPSGGFHLNYRMPDFEVRNDTHGKVLGPGVDIKGDYGYRVAPGSKTEQGEYVVSRDMEYAEAPAWLLDLLRERTETKAAERAQGAYEPQPKVEDPDECCQAVSEAAVASLVKYLDRLKALPEGQRLTFMGAERGWDDGFWLLATRLVEVALWPWTPFSLLDAETLFFQHAPAAEGSYDPEHIWERALETADEWAKGATHRIEEHGPAVLSKDDLGVVTKQPFRISPAKAPFKFAEELIDRKFRTEDGTLTLRAHNGGPFWLWNVKEARYVLLTDDEVSELVSRLVRDAEALDNDGIAQPVNLKPATLSHIVTGLRTDTLNSKRAVAGELLPCKGGVPFRNGWLDARTGELLPIGPDRDVRWNVPLSYTPDGPEPVAWFAFLDSLGWTEGTEERRLLRQWFGYLLSGRTEQQKALLLLGPKRAGKGTILKVAHGMLGEGAVGTQLDKFSERFGMENFIGAGCVTIGDARFGTRTEAKVVERILSLVADDEMTVDTKYGKVQNLRLGIRLMIATNELPNFIEASDAIASRFLVLNLTQTFYGREDLTLGERVMGELDGIVRWALGGLADLDGLGSFSETKAGREVQQQMILDSAPVRMFVEECCELGPSYRIENTDLYDEYRLWAERNGLYVLSSPKFGRDLITAFPGEVSHGNFKKGGKNVRAKFGIRMAV